MAECPPTFIITFDAEKANFSNLYSTFTDAGQDEIEGTDAKINANNAIYDTLMAMFEDGQAIYEENASKRARFIFARVLALITNNSSNGGTTVPANEVQIGMYIINADTLLPVEGATLTIQNLPGGITVTATSNSEGIIEATIPGFTANETRLILVSLSADGYETDASEEEITAGNYYSIEVEMMPVSSDNQSS